MPANQCPQRTQLNDYLVGRIDEASAESVDKHLAVCTACQTVLAACDETADTLIAALKQKTGESEFDSESELAQALACISSMRAGDDSPGRDVSLGDTSIQDATKFSGLQLGQYRLLNLLGEGGMGAVYKAEHARLEMIVAVKVLADHLTDDAQAIARFDREMKAVGKVSHPNIVRATDAGEVAGRHYLAMEFVDGRDLSQLVRALGRLQINDACEVIRQAAAGIQHAHGNGLIHRDLKPSNLMLTRDGCVKVLDLGLARLHMQSRKEGLTADFQVMGTADYMAPEQALKAKEVDSRADIYSLGCTLYALLCGRPPFSDEKHDSSLRKLMAHEQEPPTAVIERRTDVPPQLSAIVDKALAKSPEDRFATASDFAEALQPFTFGANLAKLCSVAADTKIAAGNTSDLSKHLAMTDTVTSLPARQTDGRRAIFSRQRSWVFLVATGLLGLLVGVAAIVLYFNTGAGTIVVEIDGEQIAAELKGQHLLITDKVNGESYALSVAGKATQRRLPLGNYAIRVENRSTGLRLDAYDFQIARNDRVVIKASVEHPTDGSPVPVDRVVAERVLELGGDIEVSTGDAFLSVSTREQLPSTSFFTYRVRFQSHVELTDDDLESLAKLSRLVDVNFRDVELNDQLVASLARIRQLQILTLACQSITTDDITPLNQLPNLRHLTLEGAAIDDGVAAMTSRLTNVIAITAMHSRLSDASLSHFANMPQLQLLSIVYSPLVKPDLSVLSELSHLSELHLAHTQVVDAGLLSASSLPHVRWLNLDGTAITDQAFEYVANMEALQRLTLRETSTTNNGLEKLRSAKLLSTLDLVDTRVNAAAIETLVGFESLTELLVGELFTEESVRELRQRLPNCNVKHVAASDMGNVAHRISMNEREIAEWAIEKGAILDLVVENRLELADRVGKLPSGDFQVAGINFGKAFYLTDDDFVQLINAPSLNHLYFQDLELSDRVLAHLVAMPKLAILELRYDSTPSHRLEQLRRLPYLTDLTIGGAMVGDEECESIRTLDNVLRLTLSGRRLTDNGLAVLGDMEQLEFVALTFAQVDGSGFVHFRKLTKLWCLFLAYTQTNDAGLEHVSGFQELKWLNLDFTKVGDQGLVYLSDLKKLDRLDLEGTNVTNSGLSALRPITSLRSLNLRGTGITDAALGELGHFTHLNRLTLGDRLSLEAVEMLQSQLPNCQIESTHLP